MIVARLRHAERRENRFERRRCWRRSTNASVKGGNRTRRERRRRHYDAAARERAYDYRERTRWRRRQLGPRLVDTACSFARIVRKDDNDDDNNNNNKNNIIITTTIRCSKRALGFHPGCWFACFERDGARAVCPSAACSFATGWTRGVYGFVILLRNARDGHPLLLLLWLPRSLTKNEWENNAVPEPPLLLAESAAKTRNARPGVGLEPAVEKIAFFGGSRIGENSLKFVEGGKIGAKSAEKFHVRNCKTFTILSPPPESNLRFRL